MTQHDSDDELFSVRSFAFSTTSQMIPEGTSFPFQTLTGQGNTALADYQYKTMGLPTTEKDEFSGRWPGEDPQEFLTRKREKQKRAAKRRVDWLKRQSKLEKLTPIWLEEIFPNWQSEKSKKRVAEMWSQGIPRSIRGKVWFLSLGNISAITDDLFNIMAERGAKLKDLLKQNSAIE